MERPTEFKEGQVWCMKSAPNRLYLVHRSPTGRKWRMLSLISFIARETNAAYPPTYLDFVCDLHGVDLTSKGD